MREGLCFSQEGWRKPPGAHAALPRSLRIQRRQDIVRKGKK